MKVNEEDGLITVARKPFYTPEKTSTMSPQEQAFLIAGNLAAVFHDGRQHETVWTNSENMLLVGEQPVMSFDGVADAGSIENRLRDILSNSKGEVKTDAGTKALDKGDQKKPKQN